MTLTLELDGDTRAIVRRRFAAPPETLYRCHTEVDLLRQWMTGYDGWSPDVFEINEDGTFLYIWAGPKGASLKITGRFLEREPPHRTLHVEVMHLPDPTPENLVETLFKDDGKGGTLLVMTMTLPSAEVREAMLETGMTDGMEYSYQQLDAALHRLA